MAITRNSHIDRVVRGSTVKESFADSSGLNGVTDSGASAVRLEKSRLPHAYTGPLVGVPDQLGLHAFARLGDATAGVAMWIPVFPVDTVKSRLQTAEGNVTIGGVIRDVWGRGGFKAFFPGFGPALARAVPANAATFLGVELAHQAMNKAFG